MRGGAHTRAAVQGMAIIGGGGLMRFAMAAAATGGTSLTPSERLFVGLAWIPKATVQAALGAASLEQALEENAGPECVFLPSSIPCGQCPPCPNPRQPNLRTSRKEAWGRDILAISALAIVLTAPLGAVAITTAGPLLLRKA